MPPMVMVRGAVALPERSVAETAAKMIQKSCAIMPLPSSGWVERLVIDQAPFALANSVYPVCLNLAPPGGETVKVCDAPAMGVRVPEWATAATR